MISILFSVRDNAGAAFARPFTAPTVAFAIRAFASEVNREDYDNSLFTHPVDYVLYRIGTFDDQSGMIQATDPVQVYTGAAARAAAQVPEAMPSEA